MINFQDFDKVSNFIKDVLDGKVNGAKYLTLPEYVNKKAEQVLGHSIKSHSISASEIRHINNNHGENGKKITDTSIPLRKEDIALLPYIMAVPDRVEKGSMDARGVESVRYYKTLSNGYAIVVEREGNFNAERMETITMWAERAGNKKSPSPYATDARSIRPQSERLNPLQSETTETATAIISPKDTAKIMQDFEKVKEKAKKNAEKSTITPMLQQILHQTGAEEIKANHQKTNKL